MSDLATSERYTTHENVQIQIYGQGTFLTAVLKNLSRTGAGLEILDAVRPLKKGDLVSLTIELKSLSKTHNLDAEVVWSQDKIAGVAFMKAGDVITRMIYKTSR
jgi:hypothetical protein